MPRENYSPEDGEEVLSSSPKSPKNKIPKKSLTTMQDDIAGLISKKNRPAKSKESALVSRNTADVEMQRKLTEVYTDGDGEIPDLTKLERSDRPAWKSILYTLIGVFAVLLVVAALGFWFFSRWDTDNFTNERITLKINTPITIISGQENVYTVALTNKEKVNIYNLELELFYPDNFQFIEAAPQATGDKNNKWSFSVLKIGETQNIELKGKMIAALNSTQTFRGLLNFKPANLNANFKQETVVDAIISSSVLNLDVSGPEKTLANQEVEYLLKYENLSQEDYSDIQIITTYPEAFTVESAEPSAEKETNNTWNIASLKAGEKGEIKIAGNYATVENSGSRDFTARLQLKQDGDYYPQSEETFATAVIKDQLSLQLIINGSGEDQPINFGDLLVYTLSYKNSGEDDLENIQIKANLNSQILDWDSLKDEERGVREKNSLIWTGRHIPNLLKLKTGEEGQIIWQLQVKDASAITDVDIGKFSVESFIEARARQTGQLAGESIVVTKPISNSVNSDLAIIAEARYYSEDNVPLGLGPIEPRVGEESTYNIRLVLTNNLHKVENVQVQAKLPNTVSWSDKENHERGDLFFKAATNEVVWNIFNLPKSPQPIEASFNVNIKPTDNDQGRILILLSNINLVAKDTETGALITKEVKALTTAFDDPILGQTKGLVQ